MKLAVLDINGKETGREVELPSAVFGVEPNNHAIYLDVKQHLANKRQGTHAAKERADIVGSTRKIKKQKGTGTARAGSIKSPIFKGGGRVFGPRPRDYHFKLNKKLKRLARFSALSKKVQQKAVVVVEDFNFDTPKTKEFKQVLYNLELINKKSTFVLAELNKNVYLSSRNLEKSNVVTNSELNTYRIMNSNVVVFSESALKGLESNFTKQ
ncbi:50S ribosomal protein L4 [Psychroflexus salis]|uniref:Large ribosomal subunit protein uL4 n=1 Tax=Psychroflexus salis TaxID=1526574 RepID=A0A917E6L2_9FLAO|nr:50S ribosomal protein L4 [Psychroflexus salis]GGE05679.1 50S ribosomal protein L4 [Psychroflexus salis]